MVSSTESDLASLVRGVFVCASVFSYLFVSVSCVCICSCCADGVLRHNGSVVVTCVAESISL